MKFRWKQTRHELAWITVRAVSVVALSWLFSVLVR